MRKLLPLGVSALAATAAIGVLATQAPALDRDDEFVLRDDETPALDLVDDEDDDDTNRPDPTRDVASRVTPDQDVSRAAADTGATRSQVAPAPRPAPDSRDSAVAPPAPSRQSVVSRDDAPAPAPVPAPAPEPDDSVDAPEPDDSVDAPSAVSRDS